MFGFCISCCIGQQGPKISCTKTQTLPYLRLPIRSAKQRLSRSLDLRETARNHLRHLAEDYDNMQHCAWLKCITTKEYRCTFELWHTDSQSDRQPEQHSYLMKCCEEWVGLCTTQARTPGAHCIELWTWSYTNPCLATMQERMVCNSAFLSKSVVSCCMCMNLFLNSIWTAYSVL